MKNSTESEPPAEPASFGRTTLFWPNHGSFGRKFEHISKYFSNFDLNCYQRYPVFSLLSEKFAAETAIIRQKLTGSAETGWFGRNWLVPQLVLVLILWFGDFAVQNFGFCRNWKLRFGRTLHQTTFCFDPSLPSKVRLCGDKFGEICVCVSPTRAKSP